MSDQVKYHFVLYSRAYCHLCDDMAEAVQAFGNKYLFTLDVVDVDADEDLVNQFDELVPVLFGRREDKDAVRLCHYFFDERVVREFLTEN